MTVSLLCTPVCIGGVAHLAAQTATPATANPQSTPEIAADVWSVFTATLATTAFEAGIFKYTVIDKAGVRTPKFYPFEALLGKANGKWRVLIERQSAEVTPAEWDKLAR